MLFQFTRWICQWKKESTHGMVVRELGLGCGGGRVRRRDHRWAGRGLGARGVLFTALGDRALPGFGGAIIVLALVLAVFSRLRRV